MKAFLVYLIVAVLLLATVVQCSAVRTSAQQIRVARVRRLGEGE